ncbi:MAG TPA: hypothetical protein DEG17_07665 [Cyanobacteria bacterium UBA11149]|nr:hypothetical protein [Cyanobacteria bacterium UBA11367]HBE60603.1 hypothetical protein [Cyanobacteria bacterium UBA11366]HBK63468.1 hypothetical protein [Cyanobacteria bacterium UBA11166]HBR73374.1 hypothetical protein [Cyanobacteria bacterium UBA11159]HBS68000.1 hypothetical protein [Cyanobacteria bacterium UBA11153]HBW88739.1 hypothetical protein [Cyanobacteria bacterium UBA11149]HCA96200.1 hypothetical protein [Cyanobacteria bacterium UBA9226]
MKRRSIIYGGVGFAIFSSASLFLPVEAQEKRNLTRRVRFPRGASSMTFNNSVPLESKHTYIFWASSGQLVTADLTWMGHPIEDQGQGLSGLSLVFPDGSIVQDIQNSNFDTTSTGDYKAIIAQPYRQTSSRYTFTLTIKNK